MEKQEIYARLTDVFHDVFDDESIVVRPELSAKDVDEWDSLAHIRLMLTVEKAFGVQYSTSEIGKLKDVGELAELVRSKTS